MIVAIIPARGGSTRIPDKNIKLFHGKPMIAYVIEAAQKTGLFDRVVVSTDSDRVSEVALSFGAEIPFRRPAALADDHATTDAALMHALSELGSSADSPEFFCCIYPTAVLIEHEDIVRGFEILRQTDATTAVTVVELATPIQRSLRLDPSGRLRMNYPEHVLTRTQDLPLAYHDAGQFYWGCTSKYLAVGKLFNADAVPVLLPRHLVHDIDTPEDWIIAEDIFSFRKSVTPT